MKKVAKRIGFGLLVLYAVQGFIYNMYIFKDAKNGTHKLSNATNYLVDDFHETFFAKRK